MMETATPILFSHNIYTSYIYMESLREYKGYLLDCAYEEDNVNKSFFKAFKARRCKALEGGKYVGDKQPKINFVTGFDPSFPDIGRILKNMPTFCGKMSNVTYFFRINALQ